MASYVIYQADVLDPEQYEEYRKLAGPSVVAAGGRYLIRGGDVELLEGELPASRTVVLEFPNRETLLEWYHGDYVEIRKLREHAAKATLYVIDGVI